MNGDNTKLLAAATEAIAYAFEAKQKLSEVTKELNDTKQKLYEARGRAPSQDTIRHTQLVESVKSWLKQYPHLFTSGEGSSYLAALCVLRKEYASYREAELKNPVPAPATVSEYKKSKEAELERVEILRKTFSKIKQELVRPDSRPEILESLVRTFNSFN